MAGVMMIKHDMIPIQKIISVACRNFMAFEGLHTFEFDEGVNTIIGGNGRGKTSLVTLITQALSTDISQRWNGKWFPNYNPQEALLEIKFIADDQEHYLRRVMLGDTTTDLHLYIGKGEERTFLRDGEVVGYLNKLLPTYTINGFENSRRDFFFWARGNTENVSSTFPNPKQLIQGVNKFLPLAKGKVVQLRMVQGKVMAEYHNGSLIHLSGLASGDVKIIFVLARIYNIIQNIKADNLSRVILIDEMEVGLDRANIDALYEVVKALASDLDCQFMITSRFVNGRLNPIRVNRAKIPRCYHEPRPSNFQNILKAMAKTSSPHRIFQNPPYTTKKFTYKKSGSFKWNP